MFGCVVMPNGRGFTLVEIIVVIAIISMLAVVAMLNFLRAKIDAHENAVKTELRTFSSSNESYRAAQNPPAYAPNIAALTNAGGGPSYLDASWNIQPKHGFNLTYTVAPPPATSYSLLARPAIPGQTGLNTYCVDQTGVIVSSTASGAANVPAGNAGGCSGGVAIP